MLHVKLLEGGEKREFMWAPAALIKSQEKKNPGVLGLSHGINKNLECVLKHISLGSWVLTINEGLEKSVI